MQEFIMPAEITQWLSSVPAIVGLVILLVNRSKVWLATTPVGVVPIWILACAFSAALTAVARYFDLVEGQWADLISRSVYLAAAGSGFREWWMAGFTKPMADSRLAQRVIAARPTP